LPGGVVLPPLDQGANLGNPLVPAERFRSWIAGTELQAGIQVRQGVVRLIAGEMIIREPQVRVEVVAELGQQLPSNVGTAVEIFPSLQELG